LDNHASHNIQVTAYLPRFAKPERPKDAWQCGIHGTAQLRIADGLNAAERLQLRLKEDLSSRQEADLVDAITELNQARIHQEAALSARARMPRSSLFDYLG
jgi:flagellin-like hook-associated protein FlgL